MEGEAPVAHDRQVDARTIRVLAFAGARDVVGSAEVVMPLETDVSVSDLWGRILARYPDLSAYRRAIRLAVNGTYAAPDDVVRPGDEVAIIPPVAGG
jgi:molybdopterin converting factor subunit 1